MWTKWVRSDDVIETSAFPFVGVLLSFCWLKLLEESGIGSLNSLLRWDDSISRPLYSIGTSLFLLTSSFAFFFSNKISSFPDSLALIADPRWFWSAVKYFSSSRGYSSLFLWFFLRGAFFWYRGLPKLLLLFALWLPSSSNGRSTFFEFWLNYGSPFLGWVSVNIDG